MTWKALCSSYKDALLAMNTGNHPSVLKSSQVMMCLGLCCLLFFLKDFLLFIYLFIYFIFGCVGSSVRARAFRSCGERGPLFIAVRGPLTIAAPPVAGHRLQTRRLSSCDSRAQLLRGTWDLPRPGLEPVSPALAGRFSTTEPPGKPGLCCLLATVISQ